MSNNKRLIARIMNGDEIVMEIDKSIISADFGALDRGSLTDVLEWGIYANRGSISFIDTDDYFKQYPSSEIEIANLNIVFYLQNENVSKRIATFEIEACKYDEATRQVDMELRSPLMRWQTLQIEAIYPFVEQYLDNIIEQVSQKSNTNILYGDDTYAIRNIKIYCPYIEASNLWDIMTKICQASMCRIFENEFGEAVISAAFPNKTPIIVNPKNVISFENLDYLKVANTSIEVTERVKVDRGTPESMLKKFNVYAESVGDDPDVDYKDSIAKDSNSDLEIKIINQSDDLSTADISINFKTPYKIYEYSTLMELWANIKIFQQNSSVSKSKQNLLDINHIYFFGISEDYSTIIYKANTNVRKNANDKKTYYVTNVIAGTRITYFEDNGKITEQKIVNSADSIHKISSNDLIQTQNVIGDSSHYDYILNTISKRYSKGIECFECDCLFNDYYDAYGNLVYEGSYLGRFEKYDIIIPYKLKNGVKVPYRINTDGTPKSFRVIGISYSYDGLLKQRLQLQEERYDID